MVYANTIEKKQPANMAGTKVTVNNVINKHSDLDNLPDGLRLTDTKIVRCMEALLSVEIKLI